MPLGILEKVILRFKMDIAQRIKNGEDSFTQFKRETIKASELAKEFVAFLNAEGGCLFFGVDDDGVVVGLQGHQIEQLNQLVGNTADQNVKPPFHPLVQNIDFENKIIVIVHVPKGIAKPYATSSGDFYIRSSADKKKLSQDELRRMFAESKRLFADEEPIFGTSIKELNTEAFLYFLKREDVKIFEDVKNNNLEVESLLENRLLLKDGYLTLAGNLLFGWEPQKYNPSFYVDCCYCDGNDISTDAYITKKIVKGHFRQLFEESLSFIKSNLKSIQVEKDFNSLGVLEIDERILVELLVNALVHRDYFIYSSIKIFLFKNRLEIISPGKLPNSLTVEKIKSGISIHRNPILNSICKYLLPYSGYGSGIKRALALDSSIEFINDTEKEEFKAVVYRNV